MYTNLSPLIMEMLKRLKVYSTLLFSIMCIVQVESISQCKTVSVGTCALIKRSGLLNVDRLETSHLRSLNHVIA